MNDINQNLIEQKNKALKYLKKARDDINFKIKDKDLEIIYDICAEVSFGGNKNIQNTLEKLNQDEN